MTVIQFRSREDLELDQELEMDEAAMARARRIFSMSPNQRESYLRSSDDPVYALQVEIYETNRVFRNLMRRLKS